MSAVLQQLPTERRSRLGPARRPDSKAGTIRRILAEGPATTADVVAETGWDRRIASGHLIQLWERGELEREPFVRKGLPGCYLYRLKAAQP